MQGYQLAFLVGAICAAVAGALAFLLRPAAVAAATGGDAGAGGGRSSR